MSGGRAPRVLAGGLAALLAVANAWAAADLTVVIAPERPAPGDIVVIHVRGAPADLAGEWAERPLRFFPVRDGMAALAGVDLDVAPGSVPWRLLRPTGLDVRLVVGAGTIPVGARVFPVQRLTLPRAQVDLDPRTLARVEAEHAQFAAALAAGAAERLWRGAFRLPLEGGRPTGGFGHRRIINGQPRQPHAGFDWAAPRGTPVVAANAGRVALVAEHFFAGRLVVLDHGQGLFTYYFHLDEARVAAGEPVAAGQPIGTVGQTGRATGPHLHFGVTLGGARVDPMALLTLALPVEAP